MASQRHLPAQDEPAADAGRWQARSMVQTKFGIVATSQTLASAAGAHILEIGGNAIDAAIAANAVLGVVEPMSDGMGGDLFAIVYEAKTGKLYGLNASGWAPAGLTLDALERKGFNKMPQRGIYSVTVPGAVAGWDTLRSKFGSMPFQRILAPAIYYAENGFPVTEIIGSAWQGATKTLSANKGAKDTYLPDGQAPKIGGIFRNRDLAGSLRLVAAHGREGFYKGSTAEALIREAKEDGVEWTRADLAEFQPEWVTPISTTYRDWTVTELPPNGQGMAALEMLNIMERFPLSEYGHNSAKALHVMIEAKKLAYSDLLRYVGDPRYTKVPVERLVSKDAASARAKSILVNRASCSVTPTELAWLARLPGADTIYMSAIDREGNMVSLIQSNYSGFGSGVVAPGTGFALQNRGALFSLERGHPNAIAPRKRPLHTIIPAFMQKGDTRIAFGIMGGWNQSQAHAQFVSNIVDFGMNIQAALEAARFTKGTFDGCDLFMETRIPAEVVKELESMGHVIQLAGPYSGRMGGGQAVMSNANGVHFGASDPRKDGAAVPENPVFENR
ncbi:MAG: gamma-glutamyltransferase [Bryobacterales bacterium]|nr:gamma-glutamyltransferase [Bryobacterales bacterium]MBV9398540.1 gamma-glutamyltransferase [Bryobacterales bacterium]